jgi:ABC-type glycerol-3-phosphate transport system permease component
MGTLALQSINALYTNHGYLLMAVLLLLLIPPILVFFFALKNLSRAWLSLGSKASEVL